MVHMTWQIFKIFLPFIFFLHAFDKKKRHNMLALMFDPRCKNDATPSPLLDSQESNYVTKRKFGDLRVRS